MDQPYIFIEKTGAVVQTRGDKSAFLGHCLKGHPKEGVYASWLRQDNKVTAECDRYGYSPLYCFNKGNQFALSEDRQDKLRISRVR